MKKWLRRVGCMLALIGVIFSAGCSRVQQTSTEEDRLEVRNDGTAIQWKYSDETDWHDLVALTELRGVSGETGKDGADGENGTDGTDGMNGTNGTNGIDGVNGINGIDGKNGVDGRDGIDGKDGTDGINGKDGKDGINGTNGKDGRDGINGTNGKDGRDGTDGINGINGKNIEVKRAGSYIQWRYEDEEWQNLVALADIAGPTGQKGVDGKDGKTPEFRVNENILQWRYAGDEIWLNIYDLSTLKGLDGKDGNTPFIGENGNWWISMTDTGIKAAGIDGKDGKDGTNGVNGIDGTDGKQIEIQKTDQYIQWRYEGGEWQNLVALADITGPSGQNGTDGEDGQDGADGKDGKDGACAGYFAANGNVYAWGTSLPFTVKKESGDLISYSSSDNKITLSKGHTYSLVFSGTVGVSAKSDDKVCGAALIDGYNSSEMAMETQTYMLMQKEGQSGRLTIAYNTVYTADEDITLAFQYTNMLFQDTNFGGSQYHITIIALD